MLKRILGSAAFALALLFLAPLAALAADASANVTIPLGQWLQNLATSATDVLAPIVLGALFWAIGKVSPAAVALLKTAQVEQLMTRAIGYGVNAVAGAAQGKELTINVVNPVIAEAAQYAIDHGPGWFLDYIGGEDALKAKIFARLPVDASVTASAAGVAPTG